MPLGSDIFSRLVGRVATVARENCVLPRLINTDFAAELAERGQTINIPISQQLTARNITPGFTPPSTDEPTPTTVPITLDNWRESAFVVTDKNLSGLDDPNSYINRQLEEAGRAIANAVDLSIWGQYVKVPFFSGTAGTTPFASSTQALQDTERVLLSNSTPVGRRALVLDPFAHANALGLPAFQNAMAFGSNEVVREGIITRALGYDWATNQNAPNHVAGNGGGSPVTNGVQAIGTTSIPFQGGSNNITNYYRQGDIITFAGSSTPYVVTANVNTNGSGAGTIPISNGYPNRTAGLLSEVGTGIAITRVASHRVNLAFHPDAFGFASRIASDLYGVRAGQEMTWPDPVSGLVLLARVIPYHYQTYFSVSCLWGVGAIRTDYACRLLG
jgi:hypothetical protein